MFRDILSNKGVLAALLFCVLIVVGSQLYSWHVKRGIEADEARTQQFLQQLETQKETHTVQDTGALIDTQAPGQTQTHLETDDTPTMSDDTDAFTSLDADEHLDVANAFLPDDFVSEEEPVEDVPVSPYGFGPYPELPEGWPADTFPAPSAEFELMARVEIKLLSQGVTVTGSNMENGRIYPAIKGTVYVKWKEYDRPDGTVRYISEIVSTGEDGARLHAIRLEKGRSLTAEDIPTDIKLVSFEGGGIDPYQFLDLP